MSLLQPTNFTNPVYATLYIGRPQAAVTLWPAQTRRKSCCRQEMMTWRTRWRRVAAGRPPRTQTIMPLHVRGKKQQEQEHCTKCKKKTQKRSKWRTILYVIAVLYFILREILLVNKRKHFLYIYYFLSLLFLFQTFAYLISHPSPSFSHYLCAQQDANNNMGKVFLLLYELYRDQCFF